MTTWVQRSEGGRARGPRGLVRAWVEVLVRPHRFFRNGVAPADQAPGLTFAIAVALAYVGAWLAMAPSLVPSRWGGGMLSLVLTLALVALVVAPATLHLTSAVLTLSLLPLVRDRAGISETVQTLAYAAAPCALAGPPVPALRVACAVYATVLLVIGLATVHRTTYARAALAALPGAVIAFGYGFGGVAALRALVG